MQSIMEDTPKISAYLAPDLPPQLSAGTPKNKIVVIGLSKTGTTTLKEMLTVLGYRVHGKNKKLIKKVHAGNMSAIDPALESFDAFKDWPWPLTYRYVLERYGRDAKFILSTRSSTEKWFKSIEQHASRANIFKTMWLSYGYYKPYGRKQEFCKYYEDFNDEARRFFANHPGQLLEFCLERGDGWEKLCQFLGEPAPDMPVPHSNRADQNKLRFNQFLNRLIRPPYELYCELVRRLGV